MKKNFLLIATLAVLASTVSAASPADPAPVVLPTYVVTAPRRLPAEQLVNDRLKELRQTAPARVVITPDLSPLKTQAPGR